MFVLDTNVISELRRTGDGRADPNVLSWLVAQDANQLFISAITVMELEIGVRRVERRDSVQGAVLRRWLDERVLVEFKDRVLAVDKAVALRCAGLHVPDPRSDRDALIAATALVHGFTVVTRNISDFAATGVTLLNPWLASGTTSAL
ncbi:type II toxin-antitoxin system VapC family toxin [Neotabrizicola sp. VNH66]|uniref:type II toxin-antitoxin system VapC family toxin n=1 Tax=Neotabrizicola sp. VNH66 TaxID=3400918 RepID=UPI003BFEAD58